MNTTKQYYLSKFENDGIQKAFSPVVANRETWGMLDYRLDQSTKHGWCIVCVVAEAPLPDCPDDVCMADRDYLYLGTDLDRSVEGELLECLRDAIPVPFTRKTLREIIVEAHLCYCGLSPNGDGIFEIKLCEPIWTANEEQAVAFAAACLSPFPVEYDAEGETASVSFLQSRARAVISTIERFYNFEAPAGQMLTDARLNPRARGNRFVRIINDVLLLAEAGDPSLRISTDLLWLMRLAYDLKEIERLNWTEQEATRLRDPNSCESLAFELLPIAAYARNGAQVVFLKDPSRKRAECTDLGATSRFTLNVR